MSDDGLCSICIERKAECAALPCGHFHICYPCSVQQELNEATCAICREKVKSYHKIFYNVSVKPKSKRKIKKVNRTSSVDEDKIKIRENKTQIENLSNKLERLSKELRDYKIAQAKTKQISSYQNSPTADGKLQDFSRYYL